MRKNNGMIGKHERDGEKHTQIDRSADVEIASYIYS